MSRFEANTGIVTNGLVLNLDAGDPDSYTRSQPPYVEVLVVAGGGGGGGNSSNNFRTGGGGGAGGVIFNSAYQLTNASPITVTIGAGGAGAQRQANSGNNSIFGSLTAIGGGGGGGTSSTGDQNGLDGGSGGGGGDYNGNGGNRTVGQGFNGGNSRQSNGSGAGASGGGGGGAGGNGPDAINTYSAQNGGASVTYSISGTSVAYAAGGGVRSCSPVDNNVGTDGATNTGTGGQGTRFNRGGNGGSGIVIVRYPGLPAATGGTITYINGHTIHKFTSSGTFTPYKWNDVSGNGNNGTLINGPVFVPNVKGSGFEFDGTDDYVNLPDLGLGSGNFTVEATIYPTLASTYHVFFRKGDDSTSNDNTDFSMGYDYNQFHVRASNASTAVNEYAGSSFTNSNGITVLTYDGSTIRMYLNGSIVLSKAVTLANIYSNYSIGRGINKYADITVRTVRVYNRALTGDEVLQNFNAQRARFGI